MMQSGNLRHPSGIPFAMYRIILFSETAVCRFPSGIGHFNVLYEELLLREKGASFGMNFMMQ